MCLGSGTYPGKTFPVSRVKKLPDPGSATLCKTTKPAYPKKDCLYHNSINNGKIKNFFDKT
jgi:hypothetical protein